MSNDWVFKSYVVSIAEMVIVVSCEAKVILSPSAKVIPVSSLLAPSPSVLIVKLFNANPTEVSPLTVEKCSAAILNSMGTSEPSCSSRVIWSLIFCFKTRLTVTPLSSAETVAAPESK